MADYYTMNEVQEMMKYCKILLIGDSNVRPLYKDLLHALHQIELPKVDVLKNPHIKSFCGDICLQNHGRKNEWTFWENRLFKDDKYHLQMFSTGYIMNDLIKQFLFTLRDDPSYMPNIIYICYSAKSSVPSRGPRRFNCLLKDVKSIVPFNTLVIVGSSFTKTKDAFGDPLFDDIPFLNAYNSMNEEYNKQIAEQTSSFGFRFLNVAYYLRKKAFRGITGQPGWESIVVRYTTFVLVTFIGHTLMIKSSGRVNQQVLTKAIAANNEDIESYRQLLLQHAKDWLQAKTQFSKNHHVDSACINAQEMLQILWKESRERTNHSHLCDSEINLSFLEKRSTTTPTVHNSARAAYSNLNKRDVSNDIRRVSSFKDGQSSAELDKKEDDEESLEEGEIRDVPLPQPPSPTPEMAPSDLTNYKELLSDVSSEGEANSHNGLRSGHQYTRSNSESIEKNKEISNQSSFDFSIPLEHPDPLHAVSNRNNCTGAIVISDDEQLIIDETDTEVVTYTSKDDVIINLDSDESHTELTARRNSSKQGPRISKKHSSGAVLKDHQPKTDNNVDKENLHIKSVRSKIVNWPTKSTTLGGESVWKWWRNYIQQNDNSLTLCYSDLPEVHAKIPLSVSEHHNRVVPIAIPKIIDDLYSFFQLMTTIEIDDSHFMDSPVNKEESEDDEICVSKPLPLALELSRGPKQKIQFEISTNKAAWSPPNGVRINVCSFASQREILSRISTSAKKQSNHYKSSSPKLLDEQNKRKLNVSKYVWSPISPWIKTPSTYEHYSKRTICSREVGSPATNCESSTVDGRRDESDSVRRSKHSKCRRKIRACSYTSPTRKRMKSKH